MKHALSMVLALAMVLNVGATAMAANDSSIAGGSSAVKDSGDYSLTISGIGYGKTAVTGAHVDSSYELAFTGSSNSKTWAQVLDSGDALTITATPDEGYEVAVTANGKALQANGNSYSYEAPASNLAVKTDYTAKKYTVTFEYNGGKIGANDFSTATVTHGYVASNKVAPKPTRDGHVLTGWSPAFAPIKSDITYTAQWAAEVGQDAINDVKDAITSAATPAAAVTAVQTALSTTITDVETFAKQDNAKAAVTDLERALIAKANIDVKSDVDDAVKNKVGNLTLVGAALSATAPDQEVVLKAEPASTDPTNNANLKEGAVAISFSLTDALNNVLAVKAPIFITLRNPTTFNSNDVVVYHVVSGTYKEVPTTASGSMITFAADSFSDYVFGKPKGGVADITVPSGGGSSSGGHGGSGSGVTSWIPSRFGSVVGGTTIASSISTAAAKSAATTAVNAAVKAGKDVAVVTFKNATVISPAAVKEIAKAATAKKIDATVAIQQVVSGKTVSILSFDAAKFTSKASVQLGVSVNDAAAIAKFSKAFPKNKIAAVKFNQKGSFGTTVTLKAAVKLNGMNTKTLCFYHYDPSTGVATRVNVPYSVDANGALSFSVTNGGYYIISDAPLSK